jgi:NTP pyrophosphatase (non-canonical NTP hydrolase)
VEVRVEIKDYAAAAVSTAIYPQSDRYIYPSLGIGGEVGELCEKLGFLSWASREGRGPARKEVGDVLWYIAATANDAGLKMENLSSWDTFEDLGQYTFSSTISIGRLAGRGGAVCELAKKCIRDDHRVLTDERRGKVKDALAVLLFDLAAICNSYGISIAEAAEENLTNLQSRKDRGTLQGSGDNR